MSLHRPTIALAIIVKNEEENLPRLIGSVKDCFDEIHVTDTGSTDDTVEVAKGLGCHVHHFEWCYDFSKARNASFEPATTDYIMWLDADDVLEGREDFMKWRDEIMHLADFWLSNYIYSSKEDGSPACTFVRERVIRRGKNINWKYFVHEGLTPTEGCKTQFIPSWRVRHMRTAADLEKDRSRNLNLFEKNKDKADPRMTYYWGKELFEANKHLEAIRKLEDAIVTTTLETHDRVLAMQYLCMSYMVLSQWDKATSLALTGLQIAPQRAEFYNIIGDCYLKTNQWTNAIPFFTAATQCELPQGHAALSPLFFHQDAYTFYPKNQLARIYANMGVLDKARAIALKTLEEHKHPETQQILDELNRITNIMSGIKTAVTCPDIVFSGTPQGAYVWDGEEYRTKGMGGSETACIEMAEWMARISGRPVKVFNARPDIKNVNGVQYLPVNQLNHYMASNKPYLHISWRHNVKLTDAPTFAWCHDLITPGIENVANYEKVICLTPFHSDFMHNMQLVPYDKIWISRNGLNPDRFLGPKVKKNENKVVFPSSPDRGLDRAILIMDEVKREFPFMELHVFYGIEHLPQYGHQALHDKLLKMFAARPWVKYHGKTLQSDLAQHLKEAVLWLHPCDFIETSCITAMEMVSSGVYTVTRRLGGLKDTLRVPEQLGMATMLDRDCVTGEDFVAYTQETLAALRERRWERPVFNDWDPTQLSWKKVAESWLEELPKLAGLTEPAILEPKKELRASS